MDEQAIESMATALEQEHRTRLLVPRGSDFDQARLDQAIREALRVLPGTEEWAIAKSVPAVIALVQGDAVFTVVAQKSWVIQVNSWPLKGSALVVQLARDPAVQSGTKSRQGTEWSFDYRGQAADAPRGVWQDIVGEITTDSRLPQEQLDRRERLARSIASRVGWNVAG